MQTITHLNRSVSHRRECDHYLLILQLYREDLSKFDVTPKFFLNLGDYKKLF